MTKRTKRIFFYAAVLVFILMSYIALLYAQGYKYNLSQGKFERTGAISLKANTSAKVFVNDKLEGNTSFFNDAFSIDGLLSGKYELSVQKDNYAPWKKTVIVEEGLVVDVPHVLLLPEEGEEQQKLFDEVGLLFKEAEPVPTISPTPVPKKGLTPSPKIINDPYILDAKTGKLFRNNDQKLEEIAVDVKGFRLSENENKLAYWTNNELWILWLNDQNYQPFHKKGDKELVTRFLIPIQNGVWFRGEDHLVLELEQKDSKDRPYSIYRIVEIDKRGGVNIVEL